MSTTTPSSILFGSAKHLKTTRSHSAPSSTHPKQQQHHPHSTLTPTLTPHHLRNDHNDRLKVPDNRQYRFEDEQASETRGRKNHQKRQQQGEEEEEEEFEQSMRRKYEIENSRRISEGCLSKRHVGGIIDTSDEDLFTLTTCSNCSTCSSHESGSFSSFSSGRTSSSFVSSNNGGGGCGTCGGKNRTVSNLRKSLRGELNTGLIGNVEFAICDDDDSSSSYISSPPSRSQPCLQLPLYNSNNYDFEESLTALNSRDSKKPFLTPMLDALPIISNSTQTSQVPIHIL